MSTTRNNDSSDAATSASDNHASADPPVGSSSQAVMAHVLFIDIVGSSRLATDQQPEVVCRLQHLVQATDEFKRAHTGGDDMVSVHTGDGMALVFFRSPEQPAGCAVEIARALRNDAFCQVRMGVHSGPVFLIQDINGARNVAGAGINQAERVMSCGGAGHILLSELVADPLRQLSRWKDRIHDAGICRVKDGILHLWSLRDAEVGNSAPAHRLVRSYRLRKTLIAAALLTVILGVGVSVLIRSHAPAVALKAAPLRSLSYSLLIKTQAGDVRPLAREMVFPPGYQIRFRFSSSQDGFLYVVNEGPPQQDKAVWTWLFPYPALNQGSSALSASTPLLLPPVNFIKLDAMRGQEKVYVIWSDHEIQELQSSVLSSDKYGQIRAADTPGVQNIISKGSPEVEVIKADAETVIRGNAPVLVKLITLEHM